ALVRPWILSAEGAGARRHGRGELPASLPRDAPGLRQHGLERDARHSRRFGGRDLARSLGPSDSRGELYRVQRYGRGRSDVRGHGRRHPGAGAAGAAGAGPAGASPPRGGEARMNANTFRRGFTLVEALVVVGILALLLGVLLPTLGHSRAKARQIRCLSNLRQMASAASAYAAASRGRLPLSYWHADDATLAWDYTR